MRFLHTPLRRSREGLLSLNWINCSSVFGSACLNSRLFLKTACLIFSLDSKSCPQQPMQPPFNWHNGEKAITSPLAPGSPAYSIHSPIPAAHNLLTIIVLWSNSYPLTIQGIYDRIR